MDTILVTGGSGFIGGHIILQLLEAGYQVRATLRDMRRESGTRAMLEAAHAEPGERLSFVAADLALDAGWQTAVAGCHSVFHVASPFPARVVEDENELIAPARDGTLRVLRAAREAGVRRVVLTSSFAAIGYGHLARARPFDETDWTDPSGRDVVPYIKSKTLAERAAWDFVAREGGGLELAVINPVGVFGPVLGPNLSASVTIVKALMDGELPATPRVHFGIVDVRDVANLHLRAMTDLAAKGERFIAVAGDGMSLHAVANLLRRRLGAAARKVPRFQMPDWLMRLVALRDERARAALPQLGIIRNATSDKARRVLGWDARPSEDALIATAESLMRLGLVGDRRGG